MAQNITLMGANYSAVPAVTLPKTGGGTASFTDVSDTTATASDVAEGKYFYTSNGVRTLGTNEGGGGGTALDILIRCNSTSVGWSTSTANYEILSGTISDIFTKSQNKELIEGRLIHYEHYYDDEEDLSADISITARLTAIDYSYEGSSFPGWGQMTLHFLDAYGGKKIRIAIDDEQTILSVQVVNG